jgi:hypothetical protein
VLYSAKGAAPFRLAVWPICGASMSQDNVEIFSKDTFLTALRSGGSQHGESGGAGGTSKATVEEPAG